MISQLTTRSFPFLLALPLALLSFGCASTQDVSAAKNMTSDAQGAEGTKGADSKKDDSADKAFKKELAEIELQLAQMGVQNDMQGAEFAVSMAEEKVSMAQDKLNVFKAAGMKAAKGKADLDLERAKFRVHSTKVELEELQSMYAEEEFAESTKELVLERGRKQVEFAERDFSLKTMENEKVLNTDLPNKERELMQALRQSQEGLRAAKAKLEKTRMSGEMGVRKKVAELEKLTKALESGDK